MRVEAASVLERAGVWGIGSIRELQIRIVPAGLVWIRAGAADLQIEQPGDEERVVADKLRVEPARGLRCHQPVLRVNVPQLPAQIGIMAVRRARYHVSVNLVELPSAFAE